MPRALALIALVALAGCAQGVLDPRGPVAAGNRTILTNSLAIMLAIVVPTILATFAFAWWFRAGNARAEHRPDWEYSGQLELLVWSVPVMVVLFLGGVGWVGSHALDPYKPLPGKPIRVQVVALDWKWLFLYPDQGVATVNRLVVPAGTPIAFRLTSATVMNSFFVPQLGSQIYAMPAMVSQLNLQADRPGVFPGLSAHYSGRGFADMRFDVVAVSPAKFASWSAAAGQGKALDDRAYADLAQRDNIARPLVYGHVDGSLWDRIVALQAPRAQRPPYVPNQGEAEAEGRK